MSENEVNTILNAVDTIKTDNEEAHRLLREFICYGNAAIQRNIEASAWVTNRDIKDLVARMDKNNGNVAKLQVESDLRKKAYDDFCGFQRNMKKIRSKWMLILLGAILFVVVVIFFYDMGMFPKIFEWLINKVF